MLPPPKKIFAQRTRIFLVHVIIYIGVKEIKISGKIKKVGNLAKSDISIVYKVSR